MLTTFVKLLSLVFIFKLLQYVYFRTIFKIRAKQIKVSKTKYERFDDL